MARVRGDELYTKSTPSDPDYVINPPAVFIDVSTYAEYAARNRTQIIRHETAEAETKTIYTVPANKVLYITNTWISVESGNSNYCRFVVNISAVARLLMVVMANIAQSPTASYTMPIKLTAGDTVQFISPDAASTMWGGFVGWIEDA